MADHLIIRLNRVDWLTLSGVASSALAVAAALAGLVYLAVAGLYLAMLVDALDGIWARRRGLSRPFGRYLDGFMDQLVYLVAPALCLYQLGFDGLWSLFLLLMLAAGTVRLAVFNDIGNLQEDSGLAYLGLPVFWSLFLLGGWLLVDLWLPRVWGFPLLAVLLCAFSLAMVWRWSCFKFKRLSHILTLTLGGAGLFLALQLWSLGHV